MQITHWENIAQDIQINYEKYDGFIILHGTDTMAYTASALSFMFKHLSKPIILTGSQVPLMEAHTDARENLIMAMLMAARYQIPEVCIYFNNRLLRGNRTQKVNAFSFAAFDSPNYPPLAEVGVNIKIRNELILPLKIEQQNLHVLPIKKLNIAQIMLYPGFDFLTLEHFVTQSPDVLILHTYGQGNAPTSNAQLLDNLKRLIDNGTIVINHTQCHKGGVEMKSYATGDALSKLGVLSAYNMTTEAVITKIMVLLSQSYSKPQVVKKFSQSLVGELHH